MWSCQNASGQAGFDEQIKSLTLVIQTLWSCQKVCDALHPLGNIFIILVPKLLRQIVDIPMCSNCATLDADFFFCFVTRETSCYHQADVYEAFNSTSRYLDDLLNIDNSYFEQMVGQIYPDKLQLNKFTPKSKTEYISNCENLWVQLNPAGSKSVFLGAYYKPHESDQASFDVQIILDFSHSNKCNCLGSHGL